MRIVYIVKCFSCVTDPFNRACLLVSVAGVLLSTAVVGSDDRAAEQARLDARCEQARQVALGPRRLEIYEECLNKFGKDVPTCRAEADGFNGNQVGRTPLYYDLPECVEAFEFQKAGTERQSRP